MNRRTYTVEAFVAHRRDLGETDKLLVLFSREMGRLSAIARGARKPGSPLAGSTDALCFAKYHLARGRQFDYMTQAQPLRTFAHLRSDLLRTACALELAEIIERALGDHQPNEAVYDLALLSMELLDGASDPAAVSAWSELHLMRLLGYHPRLNDCASCHRQLPPRAAFSSSAGGLLCRACSEGRRDALGLSAAAVAEIRALAAAQSPPPSLEACGALRRVYRTVWQHVLDSDLRSANFLDDLLSVGRTEVEGTRP